MKVHFQRDLERLEREILLLGSLVEQATNRAIIALTSRRTDLAREVIEGDDEIDRREVALEDDCLKVLALHQPVASDLRYLIAALKVNTMLERMGDLAVNIADRAVDLAQAPPLRPMHDLASLADLSESQLRKALDAFVEKDVVKAEEVLKGDDLLDALYLKIFNDLLAIMMEDSRAIRRATSLMFAAKHLERFGDHAMNLAEMVIYMVRGTDVRHPKSRLVGE